MNAYKARIKLKDLKQAITIPPEISSPEVEVIILSDSKREKSPQGSKKYKNLAGILHRYAKPESVKHEKEIARTKAVKV